MEQFRCAQLGCRVPFAHIHQNGIVWVERNADAAFKRALMDGVPVSLRGKMQLAVSATPNPAKDYAYCQRYFGGDLQMIADRIKPLSRALDDYLRAERNMPGLEEWMILTGYTNHYRMVVVMNEWALMKVETIR